MEQQSGAGPQEQTDAWRGRANAALVTGIIAIVIFPIGGLILGAVAAILGNKVRMRYLAGEGIPADQVRRASYGTLMGLGAIVLNILFALILVLMPFLWR